MALEQSSDINTCCIYFLIKIKLLSSCPSCIYNSFLQTGRVNVLPLRVFMYLDMYMYTLLNTISLNYTRIAREQVRHLNERDSSPLHIWHCILLSLTSHIFLRCLFLVLWILSKSVTLQ